MHSFKLKHSRSVHNLFIWSNTEELCYLVVKISSFNVMLQHYSLQSAPFIIMRALWLVERPLTSRVPSLLGLWKRRSLLRRVDGVLQCAPLFSENAWKSSLLSKGLQRVVIWGILLCSGLRKGVLSKLSLRLFTEFRARLFGCLWHKSLSSPGESK